MRTARSARFPTGSALCPAAAQRERTCCHPRPTRAFSTSCPRGVASHYATLGVDRSADISDIKGAYYKLAKTYHPDVNKTSGASDRFLAIQTAYATLSDDNKRKTYDRDHIAPSAAPRSSFGSGPSRPAGYYDPFASFGAGDYRTTYTYEDLKRAAQGNGPNANGFFAGEWDEWEDVLNEDEDLPPGWDPWEDGGSRDTRGRTGFTSHYGWDEFGDLGSSAARGEDFDEFLSRLANQAGRDPRNVHGAFSPHLWEDKRRGAKQKSKKARAYEYAFGVKFDQTRRPKYSPPSFRGPEGAAAKAMQAERDRRSREKKRRGASQSTGSEVEYDASVTVSKSAARSGTVLNRVPLAAGGPAGAECGECEGTGAYLPRIKTSKCRRCRGKGFITFRAVNGQKHRGNCPVCDGMGYFAKAPPETDCEACDGTGVAHGREGQDGITVRVRVPARTKDQDVLRVPIGRRGHTLARVMVRVAP